ncbi:GntR family transcriptional regulator [Brevibacterium jeotgali]|uniref:Transcriptional regulator, GntR family n=1 Tax=Brevibacterium jeotgali TaxID=1262550 RepID=A0A2H1L4R2_9MICO|nr:GntR family transcriptional regulator [Brevibacterium jeotgali]TWC01509.1 DNA-binding GntR family transcriptional regulator [Brevibacterium jeotgali]SMY11886.1 transcriptional regulator, GntR family [Brevibacterium jeotgali]
MSLRETALEEIRSAIAVGDLGEDRIFSAAGLAKTLGMSLSPVREAMMSLVADGTVEAVPNRGYRLVPVTRADLDEILHLRLLLAAPAVQALCDARDPVLVRNLRTAADDAVVAAEAEDRKSFFAADRRFHFLILSRGLGERAASIGLRLRDQSRVAHDEEKPRQADRDSAAQLNRLIDLIEAGEAERAVDLVDDNLRYFLT